MFVLGQVNNDLYSTAQGEILASSTLSNLGLVARKSVGHCRQLLYSDSCVKPQCKCDYDQETHCPSEIYTTKVSALLQLMFIKEATHGQVHLSEKVFKSEQNVLRYARISTQVQHDSIYALLYETK